MFTGIYKVIVSFPAIYMKKGICILGRKVSPKGPKIVERPLWTLPDAFWTYFLNIKLPPKIGHL